MNIAFTEDGLKKEWKLEDRAELNDLVEQIKYFKARMDVNVYNSKVYNTLKSLVDDLITLKRAKAREFYTNYGRAKTIQDQ